MSEQQEPIDAYGQPWCIYCPHCHTVLGVRIEHDGGQQYITVLCPECRWPERQTATEAEG